jgi:acyl-CoA thioesterase-2
VPASPVADLLDQLQLEAAGPTTFRAQTGGPGEGSHFRMFGGLVAAQALRAGQLTVRPGFHANSLHGYFIAEGKLGEELVLEVDALRDGRSFSTRSVVARQDGRAIFSLLASFHADEVGGEYQVAASDVPDPEDASATWSDRPHPDYPPAAVFEFRDVPVPPLDSQGSRPSAARWWARTVEPLPDDRDLHTCVLTYLSDLHGLTSIAIPLGVPWNERRQTASLDHSVHFHRPIRMDEWVLVEMCPVSNSGNRGLIRNTIHARDGGLGASVSQEGLLRLRRGRETAGQESGAST